MSSYVSIFFIFCIFPFIYGIWNNLKSYAGHEWVNRENYNTVGHDSCLKRYPCQFTPGSKGINSNFASWQNTQGIFAFVVNPMLE